MSERFSLRGRTALVTGGARGCGLAFAEGLAEAGADVAIFDILEQPADTFHDLSNKYNVRTAYFHVDVGDLSSLRQGFTALRDQFLTTTNNKLDICVACAGVNRHLSFLDTDEVEFERLHSINVKGVYFTAQLAAKEMIACGTTSGSIILVASIASYMAIRSQLSSAYCGTKGAVRAMCPPIAAELVKYGIRVNSVSPGYVRTEMTAQFPHLMEGWADEIMINRVAEPDDIRGACVFLASDASRYMTGQDICVDGGVTKW